MNKKLFTLFVLLVLAATVLSTRPPRPGRPPRPSHPPRPIVPFVVDPPVEPPSCGGEEPHQHHSTCCPSNPWAPDDYPPSCDFYPIDPRFEANTCEYHETTSGIPCSVREHFMQVAMNFTFSDSNSSCPPFPFGTIIVNHTAGPTIEDAEIIAIGRNLMNENGSPIWHGEITAIEYAAQELALKFGRKVHRETELWQQLSLYTTGEPCPMCAGAIRYARFGEVIQAATIDDLNKGGYYQTNVRVWDVQRKSNWCQYGRPHAYDYETSLQTRVVVDVLRDEIAPYFFAGLPPYPCPTGCHRPTPDARCEDI